MPRAWDLLSALKALVMNGYGSDPRLKPLLDLVLERQDGLGRWICGSVSRTWRLSRATPWEWVTLDALRVVSRI